MKTRIVFIGCVELSYTLFAAAIDAGANIVGLVTRASSPGNADFARLDDVATRYEIPVHFSKNINAEETVSWITGCRPDIIFCFGWSQLLKADVLSIARMGVLGYHPALLPQNRGRHPIIWALVLGLEETGSTFFIMDEGADSGGIVSQRQLPITHQDDARSLYERVSRTATEQLQGLLQSIEKGSLDPVPQRMEIASSWRKRSASDGQIDWRMPATGIYNLVRALRPPYPGATIDMNGQSCRIMRVDVVDEAAPNIEPGRVISVDGQVITVKAGIGVVRVIEHEIEGLPEIGSYL